MTTLIDARSPAEYAQGHIPGAINIPLLDNEERAQVGLCYKVKGHNAAVELGFDLVGPKTGQLIRAVRKLGGPFTIYCARGGLRSSSLNWILSTAGISCSTYEGGYKRYRRSVLEEIARPRNIQLIGGLTGCGKTDLLKKMRAQHEQVLDLEDLANHRGSVFGGIGMKPQPSYEQFENNIATVLAKTDPAKPLWIEDESRFIGLLQIPASLFQLMQQAPLTTIEKKREERLERIIQDYGNAAPDALIQSVEKIRKKLGGERTKKIKEFIESQNLYSAVSLLLEYYDKAYIHSSNSKQEMATSQQYHPAERARQ